MDEHDILRESLQVIADRVNKANALEAQVKELEEKVATLEKNASAAAAIPPGYVLVPAAQAAAATPPAAPVVAPAPAAPAPVLNLVSPNGAQS